MILWICLATGKKLRCCKKVLTTRKKNDIMPQRIKKETQHIILRKYLGYLRVQGRFKGVDENRLPYFYLNLKKEFYGNHTPYPFAHGQRTKFRQSNPQRNRICV